jgi:hypothetical protein
MSRADRMLALFNYSIVGTDGHDDDDNDDENDDADNDDDDDEWYEDDKEDYVSHHDSEHAYSITQMYAHH